MSRIRSFTALASMLVLGSLRMLSTPTPVVAAPGAFAATPRAFAATPGALAASPRRSSLDSLLHIAPYEVVVHPEIRCATDPIAFVINYCNTCAMFLRTERVSETHLKVFLSTRVDADTSWNGVMCPKFACPAPSVHAEMGLFASGHHDVKVETITRVILPDSSSFEVSSNTLVAFDVGDSCNPPPPPPVDYLPYVRSIAIGSPQPCVPEPVACPGVPTPVRFEGYFPDNCYRVRRIELFEPIFIRDPGPHPPIVRILVDDMACLGRPCVVGGFPWSAEIKLPGLPAGDYRLPVEIGTVTCNDSFPRDSSVHAAFVPFTVVPNCDTPIGTACLLPGWEHPHPTNPCDDVVSPDHPAHLVFEVRSNTALSGLQGRLVLAGFSRVLTGPAKPTATQAGPWTALDITAIEAVGPASNMHLQWSAVEGGARFVLFADAGAPIPAVPPGSDSLPGVPVLRVTVARQDSGYLVPENGLFALDLLGADVNGAGVPECDLPCVRHDAFARICIERHDCDVNHDGTQDVRDLVTMVHCVLGTGSCPDSASSAFDCDGDGHSTLDDVLCCASVILRGHLPDTTQGRPEPGIAAEFGDPVRTAEGVDVPLALSGEHLIGAARLALAFPTDKFVIAGVGLERLDPSWLELHQADASQLLIGLIRTTGPFSGASATVTDGRVHLTIHLTLRPGAEPGGMVSLASGDFSGPDGAALAVDLGSPAQALGDGPIGLSSVQPNPFGRETHFAVKLARPARVELEIHDLVGRRIATLHRGTLAAGTRVFTWNGHDSDGSRAANGVYFVRLVADGRVTARKVVLVRAP